MREDPNRERPWEGVLLEMMPNVASVRHVLIVCAAALTLPALSLALPASAEEMAPDGMAEPPANLDCAAEPITGSGAGFLSNREDSEEAARVNWLEKVADDHPGATWETAKDASIACAVQGLYSKCFAQGIPCTPKGDGGAAAANTE